MQINNLEDKGWEAMSQLLDQEMPQERRKKRFFFWYFFGAFAFLVIMVIGWYLFDDNTQGINVESQHQLYTTNINKNYKEYTSMNTQSTSHTIVDYEYSPDKPSHFSNQSVKPQENHLTQKRKNLSLISPNSTIETAKSNSKKNTERDYSFIKGTHTLENMSKSIEKNTSIDLKVAKFESSNSKHFNNHSENLRIEKNSLLEQRVKKNSALLQSSIKMLPLAYGLKKLEKRHSEISVPTNSKWKFYNDISLYTMYLAEINTLGYGLESLLSLRNRHSLWSVSTGLGYENFKLFYFEKKDILNESNNPKPSFSSNFDSSSVSIDYLVVPVMVFYHKSRFKLGTGIRYGINLKAPSKIIMKEQFLLLSVQLNYQFFNGLSVFAGYNINFFGNQLNNSSTLTSKANKVFKLHNLKAGISFRF